MSQEKMTQDEIDELTVRTSPVK